MLDNITKHKWLIILAGGFAVWLITINTRIFESAEQRISVVQRVADLPSAESQWRKFYRDSVNTASADHKRQESLRQQKYSDSVHAVKDSIALDLFKRIGVQQDKMDNKLDSIIKNH